MKVFLSSTFTDLIAERDAVLKALRRAALLNYSRISVGVAG